MSQRNTLRNKKLRSLARAMRRAPDAQIDLVQWLRDRRYADTAGGARKLLAEGRVFFRGEPVGRIPVRRDEDEKPTEYVADALVPASFRTGLTFA